jgi:hypothetical protein
MHEPSPPPVPSGWSEVSLREMRSVSRLIRFPSPVEIVPIKPLSSKSRINKEVAKFQIESKRRPVNRFSATISHSRLDIVMKMSKFSGSKKKFVEMSRFLRLTKLLMVPGRAQDTGKESPLGGKMNPREYPDTLIVSREASSPIVDGTSPVRKVAPCASFVISKRRSDESPWISLGMKPDKPFRFSTSSVT